MKKSTMFMGLAGLASGVVLANNWRVIVKEGIKLGLKASVMVKEVSQQAIEDIGDLTAEATQELSESDREVM
jgi:UTP-glucose-1-phosphate uridylyltransferase